MRAQGRVIYVVKAVGPAGGKKMHFVSTDCMVIALHKDDLKRSGDGS